MDFLPVVLSTDAGIAAAVSVLIVSGSALRAVAGRAASVVERRFFSPGRRS